MRPDRKISTPLPWRVIIQAVAIAVAVTAFVIVAIYETGRGIRDAKLTGTVTAKEFVPASQAEKQITLSRDGTVAIQNYEGDFILTVDVRMPNGEEKQFRVWMPTREQFEKIQVGDRFDVGPYLVK